MKILQKLLISSLLLFVVSCGSSRKKYIKSPLDIIITTYIDIQNYSVILTDMDYKEDSDSYFHKYKIILEKNNKTAKPTENDFEIKRTDWKKVSPITFEEHQKDLGMTVLSKKNGVLDKKSTPAGYNNYVGNQKYGSWERQSNGSSFWAFYGQYHFMSSILGGIGRSYGRNDYDYYRNNNHGRTSYYGRNNTYGTSSTRNTSSTWNSKPQSFKEKVRSNVKRSSSALKSKGYSSSKSYKSSSRTTRNTNRYSSSSSSRSRSGGYGK